MQKDKNTPIQEQFQTPEAVANYMASLLPFGCKTILEPTPGLGNLVKAAKPYCKNIIAPNRFEDIEKDSRFDAVIMNPPFTPMAQGYEFLFNVMPMSDNVIALLPWLVIINSEKRLKAIQDFGLVSITNLPRKTFPGTRIQCCILVLQKGYLGVTTFKSFNW